MERARGRCERPTWPRPTAALNPNGRYLDYGTTLVTDDDDDPKISRYEWERWIRRCQLTPTVKLVAFVMAQYAARDGSRIYPGVNRLAAVTGLSERSVRSAQAK